MQHNLQELWVELRLDHPSHTRPDLIEEHFEKRLELLLQFKNAGLERIKGETMSVDEHMEEASEILRIIQGK